MRTRMKSFFTGAQGKKKSLHEERTNRDTCDKNIWGGLKKFTGKTCKGSLPVLGIGRIQLFVRGSIKNRKFILGI